MAADVVSEVRCGSRVGGSAHSLLNVPHGATSEPTDASAIVLISDFSLGTEEDIGDVDSDEDIESPWVFCSPPPHEVTTTNKSTEIRDPKINLIL